MELFRYPPFIVWFSEILGLPEPTYDVYPYLKQFVRNNMVEPTTVLPSSSQSIEVVSMPPSYSLRLAQTALEAGPGVTLTYDDATGIFEISSETSAPIDITGTESVQVEQSGNNYRLLLGPNSLIAGAGVGLTYDATTGQYTITSTGSPTSVVAEDDTITVIDNAPVYSVALSPGALVAGTNVTLARDPGTGVVTINAVVPPSTSVVATDSTIDVTGGPAYGVSLSPNALVAGTNVTLVRNPGTGVVTINAGTSNLQFWTESRNVANGRTTWTPTTASDVSHIAGRGLTTNALQTTALLGIHSVDFGRQLAQAAPITTGIDVSILGGIDNRITTGIRSAIVSGEDNSMPTATNSLIGAGSSNVVSSTTGSAVVAGVLNTVSGGSSIIGAGENNTVGEQRCGIASGLGNSIAANCQQSFIGAGQANSITDSAYGSMIGAGRLNAINTLSNESAIVSGFNNKITGQRSFIGAGENNSATGTLSFIGAGTGCTTGNRASVSSGSTNAARALQSHIGGGTTNEVQLTGTSSSISSGQNNTVASVNAHIGAGESSTISSVGARSCIGAGAANQINATNCFIGAGSANVLNTTGTGVITLLKAEGSEPEEKEELPVCSSIVSGSHNSVSALNSTVVSGRSNTLNSKEGCGATNCSTIVAGEHNTLFTGRNSSISHGQGNRIDGEVPVVDSCVGGRENELASDMSFMTGYYSRTTAEARGSFTAGAFLSNSASESCMVGAFGDSSSSTLEHTALAACSGNFDNEGTPVYIGRDSSQNSAILSDTIHTSAPASYYYEKGKSLPVDDKDCGYFVKISSDGKTELADSLAECFGVSVPRFGLVHNAQEREWYGKYKRDEFGNLLTRESYKESLLAHLLSEKLSPEEIEPFLSLMNNRKHEEFLSSLHKAHPRFAKVTLKPRLVHILSEDYDKEKKYVPRSQRHSEWVPVCSQMIPLKVRDDGSCVPGGFCGCAGGVATRSDSGLRLRVLKRISKNVVLVLYQ